MFLHLGVSEFNPLCAIECICYVCFRAMGASMLVSWEKVLYISMRHCWVVFLWHYWLGVDVGYRFCYEFCRVNAKVVDSRGLGSQRTPKICPRVWEYAVAWRRIKLRSGRLSIQIVAMGPTPDMGKNMCWWRHNVSDAISVSFVMMS